MHSLSEIWTLHYRLSFYSLSQLQSNFNIRKNTFQHKYICIQQTLVIQKYNYSEDNKREVDYFRKKAKISTFLTLQQTRNELKKIRIKYIKEIEQTKERKQKKNTFLPQSFFLSKFLQQQNTIQNDDQSDNSSIDSSDLSDYKFELQLEKEKSLIKKQYKSSYPYLSSYYDKHFYARYPKIVFSTRQLNIQTSSSDNLSDEKSESQESEGTQFINNINMNLTLKQIDLGQSDDEIESPTNFYKEYESKYKDKYQKRNQINRLNSKISNILKQNEKDLMQSYQNKNLRKRKNYRPDSAPQRKSIEYNFMPKEISNQQKLNNLKSQKRPSSSTIFNKIKKYGNEKKEDEHQQLKPQIIQLVSKSKRNSPKPKKPLQFDQDKPTKNHKGSLNQSKPQQLSLFSKGKTSSEFYQKDLKNDDEDEQNQLLSQNNSQNSESESINSDSQSKNSESESKQSVSESKNSVSQSKNSGSESNNSESESKNLTNQSIKSIDSKEIDSYLDKKSEQKIKSEKNVDNRIKSKVQVNKQISKLSIEENFIKEDTNKLQLKQIRKKQQSVPIVQGSNKQITQQNIDSQQDKDDQQQFITKIKMKKPQQKIQLIKSYLAEGSDEEFFTYNQSTKQDVSTKTIQFLQENILDPYSKGISFSKKQISQISNERLSDRQIQFFEKTLSTVSNEKQSERQIQFMEKTLSINSPKTDDAPRRTCLRSKTINVSKQDKLKNSPGSQNSYNHPNLNNQNSNNSNNVMLQSIDRVMRDKSQSASSNAVKNAKIQNSPQSQINMIQSNNNNNNNNNNPNNNNHNALNMAMTVQQNKDKNQLIEDLHSDQVELDEKTRIELNHLFMFTYLDKMKLFKIYFPNNNMNSILEQYNKYCIKKILVNRTNQQKTNNQSSIIPVIGHQLNAFSFINQMKKRIVTKVRPSILNQNN